MWAGGISAFPGARAMQPPRGAKFRAFESVERFACQSRPSSGCSSGRRSEWRLCDESPSPSRAGGDAYPETGKWNSRIWAGVPGIAAFAAHVWRVKGESNAGALDARRRLLETLCLAFLYALQDGEIRLVDPQG